MLREKAFVFRLPNWLTKYCSFCEPQKLGTTSERRFEHQDHDELEAEVWYYEKELTRLYWRNSLILLPETDFAKEYQLSPNDHYFYCNRKYLRLFTKISKIARRNRINQLEKTSKHGRSHLRFRGNGAVSGTYYSSSCNYSGLGASAVFIM